MRRSLSVLATLFMLVPLAILGQHSGRHSSASSSSGTTAQPEDPDLVAFKHAVAVQATEGQIAQFRIMIKSTETARQQAHDLQHLGSTPNDSEVLTSKAVRLQNSVDEAQEENRTFRRSLSDAQDAGLKNLTKKVTKSDAAVTKEGKAISQQLEQRTLDPDRLKSIAPKLEKALAVLESDQLNLGKGMGTDSR